MKASECKAFLPKTDFEIYQWNGRWKVSISIGDEYYETDPYKRKEDALNEARDYLGFVKTFVDRTIKEAQ